MTEAERLRIGPWTVTPALNRLDNDTRSIKIEPRAMDVLLFLAQQDGAVVSVDAIVASVWHGVAVGDGSVYLAISQLRQALGDGGPGTRYIETIPKRGYRLAVPVERVEREPVAVSVPSLARAAADEPHDPLRPARPGRMQPVAMAVLVGITVIALYVATVAVHDDPGPAAAVTKSVALLPFENLSSDPGQEYFADGITIELLNALSRVRDLRVTGHASSFQFRDSAHDLPSVGAALGVEHVLEGSVRKAGDQVRIGVQLTEAGTGERLWSETYERKLDDIFLIEDEIAKAVADALQIKLGVGDVGRAPGMTHNVAAYDEYLRGMSRNLDWRPESIPLAIAHLQRAVALDPSFSIAWAGLSTVYANAVFVVPDRAEEWRQKGTAALAQASSLTPGAPHVLLETGIAEARRQNWLAAARAFDRLEQSYAQHGLVNEVWGPRGVQLLAVGRVREAIPALERARAHDPLAVAYASFLSAAHLADGNLVAALAEVDRGLRLKGLQMTLLKTGLVTALTQRDRAEIDKRLRAFPDGSAEGQVNRRLAQFLDAPAGAAAEIRHLASSSSPAGKAMLAQWAAFYHQPAVSQQLLTEVARQLSHPVVLWQPLLRDVRKRPGFKDLVRNLRLVDYWHAYGWSDFCRPSTGDDFECQ